MKKILFVILPLMLMSQGASARNFVEIYTQCGLGSMVTPQNEGIAAFINVTWDSGSTASTSALSSEDTCKGTSSKTASFIHENYQPLEKDLAMGQGQHLAALVAIPACNSNPAFVSKVRADFAKMVASSHYASMTKMEKSSELYSIFEKNLQKSSCSLS